MKIHPYVVTYTYMIIIYDKGVANLKLLLLKGVFEMIFK